MPISQQLREAIRAYGSEYAVARDSGVPQAVVNRFASGQRDLKLATADRLAEFFGMKLTKTTRKAKPRKGV